MREPERRARAVGAGKLPMIQTVTNGWMVRPQDSVHLLPDPSTHARTHVSTHARKHHARKHARSHARMHAYTHTNVCVRAHTLYTHTHQSHRPDTDKDIEGVFADLPPHT